MRPRQLSLLSAGVRPVSPADVEGLLLGPGRLVRMGGTARFSALLGAPPEPVVDPRRRAVTLVGEFAARGIAAEWLVTDSGVVELRTPFVALLGPLAQRWLRGASIAAPEDFALDGARIRLWAVAAGAVEPRGFRFELARREPQLWPVAAAAFTAAGLPGKVVGEPSGGAGYRITGATRLARLAELVGEAPPEWTAAGWPG